MIKDTITYKKQVLLTIYHKGFSEEHRKDKCVRKEHIGRNVLTFTEESVAEDEWEKLGGYAWEESGLLLPKEKHNPYSEAACANMVHRVYLDKPQVIWKKDGTGIASEELEKILEFIKTYTGMNLEEKPVFLGDQFLFEVSEFTYHGTKGNSVILYDLAAGMKVVLFFKKGNEICRVKQIAVTEDTEELEVDAECEWDNHDIEIFKENELIYVNREVSYIRQIHISYSLGGRRKRIPLMKLKEYFEVEQKGGTHESVIGEPKEEVQDSLDTSNRVLVRNMKLQKEKGKALFVRPGELDIAMKKITEMIFQAEDELWLFDAYFTDEGHGLGAMTDWLRLIAASAVKEAHVVFYAKEGKALEVPALKEYLEKDSFLRDSVAMGKMGRLFLHQTKKPIHDRFLISRNKDTYSGISVGTSFNSLDTNHYCIYFLPHLFAKEVCEELQEWMDANLVCEDKI